MRAARLAAGLLAVLAGAAVAAPRTVQKGDTLYSLARAAGLTVAQLQALNGLTGTDIKVGQVLQFPDVPGAAPALPVPPTAPPAPPPGAVTRAGCCANAAWTPDGDRLVVLDGLPGRPVGLYRVDPADPAAPGEYLGPPTLLSADGAFGVQPEGPNRGVALRLADGARAPVPTGGRDAAWSPSGRLAWPTYGTADRDDWIPLTVLVADPFTGIAPRAVVTVYGGRLVGWLDDTTLLVTGRVSREDARRAVLAVNAATGRVRALARGTFLSGVRIAPDDRRVLYRVTLDTPGQNGLFVADVAGGAPTPLPVFGSARWQDGTHLLAVPYEPGAPAQRLVRVDVPTSATEDLGALPDRITQDDWSVSPDGTHVVYLAARDRALHVLAVPAPPIGPLPPVH